MDNLAKDNLQIFNTMGHKLEYFKPIHEGKVGFYGCGPTVYNYAHIGNLRAYVFQDILDRTLEFLGYDVTHVINITDIGHLTGDEDDGEDKMLKTAEEKGKEILEIADFYTKAFFKDTDNLNIKRPNIVCKATDHVQDMIELIKKIEANGHTYQAGGNLYYDISTYPEYGKLARLNLDDLKAGARIDIDKNKKNPYDFVLWFTKSKYEKHALTWDSPWGRGYPGWHIECSAMSMKYLGEEIDIHTGGIDHIPIHHTNEIAQSEGATNHKWVNYWLHNEFLVVDKGKMSKSSGNFLTLDVLTQKGYDPLDYRYFLLGGHYRSQLTFSWDSMDGAKNTRKNLAKQIAKLTQATKENQDTETITEQVQKYIDDFTTSLCADLSTPKALATLWALIKDNTIPANNIIAGIKKMDFVLGLSLLNTDKKEEQNNASTEDSKEIEALITERAEAKKSKNFARADEIRNQLKDMGVVLEDSPSGTIWKKI